MIAATFTAEHEPLQVPPGGGVGVIGVGASILLAYVCIVNFSNRKCMNVENDSLRTEQKQGSEEGLTLIKHHSSQSCKGQREHREGPSGPIRAETQTQSHHGFTHTFTHVLWTDADKDRRPVPSQLNPLPPLHPLPSKEGTTQEADGRLTNGLISFNTTCSRSSLIKIMKKQKKN